MAKGENIFLRKDGRWEARYMKGKSSSGKPVYGYCYGKTYREAKEKVGKARADWMDKCSRMQSRDLFETYAQEWLELIEGRVKESTMVKYTNILERHLLPCFGEIPVQNIDTVCVSRFSRTLRLEGMSPKSIRDILTLLKSIFKYIEKQNRSFKIPDFVFPKEGKKEMRILTQEEMNALIDELNSNMKNGTGLGIVLGLSCGLRIGEVCALQWKDINMETSVIHVSRTMQRLKDPEHPGKTHIVISTPKSESSIRSVPLSSLARKWARDLECPDPQAYVLTGTRDYMEPRALQYRFGKVVKVLDLKGVHFHTLRHTFATRCIEVGFEMKSLSEILGHSSISVTMDRYVHSSMSLKQSNMEKLARIGL